MLTLWYIILGWKEYNKPFRKVEQSPKPVEPAKKPDLIPLKKDGPPTKPTDVKSPDPPPSIPISPKPPAPKTPEPPSFSNKSTEPPKLTESKGSLPPPKTPEKPEIPKTPTPTQPYKPSYPTTPEPPKAPQPPTQPIRPPETPRLGPEPPNKPETPKTPDDLPKTIPPRSPDIPFSARSPVPSPNQSEFPLPPYLPAAPRNKPTSRDDDLFAASNAFSSPSPNRPTTDLRDLSYAKGEFPGEELGAKVKETLTRIPKYMEQSVISNPDSLESDEEDQDF